MKFIVASGELQKALNVVSGVISSSQSRPILENFLFELENEILKITASDGETTLITSLAVKSDDQGKIAVPAKIFQDLIKTFGDQPLTFSVKDSESGEGGLLEILDEKDNYEVALDNAEDYPELPEFDASQKVTLASGVLADALSNTLFATSNDSLRPVMTGVLFQFTEKETNFVSTDSHRLVVYKRTDVINVQTYNTAMYIFLATALLFIAFIIVGFFIFLKNNISNRTNELALYRALGYKTKHIFYIIFTEHIILALISIFIGIIFAFLLGNLIINPYIYSLLGNTIMEMTVKITIGEISTVILMIILLLFIVCKTAVKRSEKTDLTVLLRER